MLKSTMSRLFSKKIFKAGFIAFVSLLIVIASAVFWQRDNITRSVTDTRDTTTISSEDKGVDSQAENQSDKGEDLLEASSENAESSNSENTDSKNSNFSSSSSNSSKKSEISSSNRSLESSSSPVASEETLFNRGQFSDQIEAY